MLHEPDCLKQVSSLCEPPVTCVCTYVYVSVTKLKAQTRPVCLVSKPFFTVQCYRLCGFVASVISRAVGLLRLKAHRLGAPPVTGHLTPRMDSLSECAIRLLELLEECHTVVGIGVLQGRTF